MCLRYELEKQELQVSSELRLPVIYNGIKLDIGFRIDLLVENLLIIELKSVESLRAVHKSQLLTY